MTQPFDTFITAAKYNLEHDDTFPQDHLDAVEQALLKAQLLLAGSPEGTVMRNTTNGSTATRVVNAEGVPLWQLSDGTTNREAVLQPEGDWTCLYNPAA